jgi:RimJ/RimL family protein N-acetyltransferase
VLGVTDPFAPIILDSGERIPVRPMSADDDAALVRFHHTLSQGTTYMRFFSVHPELTSDEVHHFTHVDHSRREALVATFDDEIIGVARFYRAAGTTKAEVAFVVSDAWQGCGIGTALFARLAVRARQLGVDRFVADTLPHNRRMLRVFRHFGLPVTVTVTDVARVEIDLRPIEAVATGS